RASPSGRPAAARPGWARHAPWGDEPGRDGGRFASRATALPHLERAINEGVELSQRYHVRPVARSVVRVWMSFEEEALRAGRDRGQGEGRNELARPAARAAG